MACGFVPPHEALATLTANIRDGGLAARDDACMGTDHAAGRRLTSPPAA
jgi:hypothetical protein